MRNSAPSGVTGYERPVLRVDGNDDGALRSGPRPVGPRRQRDDPVPGPVALASGRFQFGAAQPVQLAPHRPAARFNLSTASRW